LVCGRLADEALGGGESDIGGSGAIALVLAEEEGEWRDNRERERQTFLALFPVWHSSSALTFAMISTVLFFHTPTHEYVVPKSMPMAGQVIWEVECREKSLRTKGKAETTGQEVRLRRVCNQMRQRVSVN
jgi:hypothetical protein